MENLQLIEYHGIRVLTSSQIAQMYGCDIKTISYNYNYNKKRFVEGKHFIKLEGSDLKTFKASLEIPDCHKYSAHLYLWTENGALLHAKSLNTNKAWEAYEYLVDYYFHTKELPAPENNAPDPAPNHLGFQAESQEIRKYLCAIDVLLTEGGVRRSKGLHDGIMGSLDVLYLSLGKKLLDLRESDLD